MDKLGCYMTTITGKYQFDCRGIMCNDCPYFMTRKEAKEKAKTTPQPHPCKECNKYECDVHCPYYGK